ncbi:MAG: hypothetical protein KDB61_12260, partial [Planctomycetes bacterium]|nr:hypothetical protein [Planctomycetota bacterium]
ALAAEWLKRHRVQPFFLWMQFPQAAPDADGALGIVMRELAAQRLLDSSLIVLTGNHGSTHMLLRKTPSQRQAVTDPRPIAPYQMPQFLLEHMSLPVAAVRPAAYLRHPIEPAMVKDGTPE